MESPSQQQQQQQQQHAETAGQQAGRLFSNFSSFLNRKQREISQAMEVCIVTMLLWKHDDAHYVI